MLATTVDFTTYQFPANKNPDDKTVHVSRYKKHRLNPSTALSQLATMIESREAQAVGSQAVLSHFADSGRVYTGNNPKRFRKQSECLDKNIQLITLDIEISKTLENLPGYDAIRRFTSVEEVVAYLNKFGIKSMLITKSSSHMRGENNYKWHVYFVLNRQVSVSDVLRWFWHILPASSWVRGLTKNGSSLSTNSMLDLSVFRSTMTTHEYTHRGSPIAYLKDGCTSFRLLYPKGINATSKPHHRAMYTNHTQRKTNILYRRKQTPAMRRAKKHMDKTGTIPPDFLLYSNRDDKGYTAQTIKDGRCFYVNFKDPFDLAYKGGPLYHRGGGVFYHHREGCLLTVDDRPSEEVIRYDGKYAPLPETLKDENSLILSETGSGKTFAAQKWLKTIFIVPTKALQRDIQENYPDTNIMRSSMKSITTERDSMQLLSPFVLNVMTYDKLAGFIREGKNLALLEGYNIVVDEVHKLVKTDNSKHAMLYKSLFKREIKFKKLCLMSATVDPSVLKVDGLVVYRYISSRKLTAKITRVFPYNEILPGKKIFIYRQSTQCNAELLEVCKTKGLKAIAVRGGAEGVRVDLPKDIDSYDVIIGTSTIDVGVSFTHHIDTVIVDNVKGATGLAASPSEIIQIVSRVRNNTPNIFIKQASTHYNNGFLDETDECFVRKPLLSSYILHAKENTLQPAETIALLKRFKEQEWLTNTQEIIQNDVSFKENALWTKETLAKADVQYTELGTIAMYIKHETRYLLADWNAAADRYWREGRIKIEAYGKQKLTFKEVREAENLLKGRDLPSYSRHNASRKDIEADAKSCMSYAQLKGFLALDLDLAYYTNLKNGLSDIEAVEHIELKGIYRRLKESIQVQSIVNRTIRQELKWHKKNLMEGYYNIFPLVNKGTVYSLTELRNKTTLLGMKLVGNQKGWTKIKLLEKLKEVMRYEMLDIDNKVVRYKTRCVNIRILKEQLFDDEDIFEAKQPEIGATMNRSTQVKIAAVPAIGGSEDEAKEEVKKLFEPTFNEEKYYNSLTEEDILELEHMHHEEEVRCAEALSTKKASEVVHYNNTKVVFKEAYAIIPLQTFYKEPSMPDNTIPVPSETKEIDLAAALSPLADIIERREAQAAQETETTPVESSQEAQHVVTPISSGTYLETETTPVETETTPVETETTPVETETTPVETETTPVEAETKKAVKPAVRGRPSKLSTDQVIAIRERYAHESKKKLAVEYGISLCYLYKVAKGKSAKHIPLVSHDEEIPF